MKQFFTLTVVLLVALCNGFVAGIGVQENGLASLSAFPSLVVPPNDSSTIVLPNGRQDAVFMPTDTVAPTATSKLGHSGFTVYVDGAAAAPEPTAVVGGYGGGGDDVNNTDQPQLPGAYGQLPTPVDQPEMPDASSSEITTTWVEEVTVTVGLSDATSDESTSWTTIEVTSWETFWNVHTQWSTLWVPPPHDSTVDGVSSADAVATTLASSASFSVSTGSDTTVTLNVPVTEATPGTGVVVTVALPTAEHITSQTTIGTRSNSLHGSWSPLTEVPSPTVAVEQSAGNSVYNALLDSSWFFAVGFTMGVAHLFLH